MYFSNFISLKIRDCRAEHVAHPRKMLGVDVFEYHRRAIKDLVRILGPTIKFWPYIVINRS